MLKDITLGQFFPGKSLAHRLDPRTKLLLTVLYIAALFCAKWFVSYALTAALLAASVKVSGVSPKALVRGLKPVLFLICFTAVLNLFYTPGDILVSFWIFKITRQGIVTAFFMVLRIMMLIMEMYSYCVHGVWPLHMHLKLLFLRRQLHTLFYRSVLLLKLHLQCFIHFKFML